MGRRTGSDGTTLRGFTTLLVLGLAFAVLEVHDAIHRLPAYTHLGVEIATSHPPLPVHVEAAVGFFDLDCPACVASLQQRGPAAVRSAVRGLAAPAASPRAAAGLPRPAAPLIVFRPAEPRPADPWVGESCELRSPIPGIGPRKRSWSMTR